MNEISKISRQDSAYPKLLKEIADPPEVLYVRGQIELLNAPGLLAVVGSRKASFYGQEAINKLLTPVARLGVPLVSGLAYGIDSMAHKVCVDNETPTVAVLGSGVDDDSIYPSRHLGLTGKILALSGAVISEYPPGTPPRQGHFPLRNRIIAGLTHATLIVQAAIKSGSLITARLALEDGRDVAAVPGYITDPLSAGTNHLIQQGATPVLAAQDILDLLGVTQTVKQLEQARSTWTKEQLTVLSVLSSTPLHTDQIAAKAKVQTSTLSVILTELELLNAVHHVGGMKYVKVS